MTLLWLPSAEANLQAIAAYRRRFSELGADRVVAALLAATDRLERFPRIGRVVPEFGEEPLRELLVGDYRVLYLVVGGDVEIHAVFHGSMDLAELAEAADE